MLSLLKHNVIKYAECLPLIMALSLKLEVKSNDLVLVTNSETGEQVEVTLNFIQKVTKSPLLILVQYRYYELVIEAGKHWKYLKKFEFGKEIESIKKIELEEEIIKNDIRSNVRQKLHEKTIAKQQQWKEVAAFNQAQRQWKADGYNIILQSTQSYNRAIEALQYADYCLKHDCRYNVEKNINRNTAIKSDLFSMSPEEQIIALKKENYALRKRITELLTCESIHEV